MTAWPNRMERRRKLYHHPQQQQRPADRPANETVFSDLPCNNTTTASTTAAASRNAATPTTPTVRSHAVYKKVRLKIAATLTVCWCLAIWTTSSAAVVAASTAAANRPPKFLLDGQQSEIVLRLKEGPETPVGTRIYTLRGFDPDGDALTFGIRPNPYDNDVLRIESAGAAEAHLYLDRELDRETRDEYQIVLTLTDQRLGDGNFVTQSLLLLVEDINDNAPVFRPYQSTIEVAEDSPAGVLTTLEATDADEGAYGQVVYYLQELDGDDGVFSISTHGGKGTIRLVRELDYEQKSLYQLRVLAVDRANQGPINTATAALLVKVRDVEDQPPMFAAINPVVRIAEDTPVGAAVVTVKAYDGDRGINNPIRYSMVRGTDDGSFAINGKTGVVYTRRELDREDARNLVNGAYILEIMATEKSKLMPPPSASTEITVILIDINDETPRFRAASYEAEISESSQENTPLTFIGEAAQLNGVYDFDQGKNGTFDLYLEPDDGVFEIQPRRAINEATFLVRLRRNSVLDYETVQRLNYTIVAREIVTEAAKWSVVPITVYVRDSNDNFPEFERPLYEFSVPENSGVGALVGRVQAIDADAGAFGTEGLRYTHLSGSIAHLLHLDAETGNITIRSAGDALDFDREHIASHHLTVEARDNLGQGNRNTVPLVLTMLDVNDNAPVFAERQYEAKLFENKPHFEAPLIVRATDADQPNTPNAQIAYEIAGGQRNARNFTINEHSGRVSVVRPLDFEALGARDIRDAAVQPIYLTVVARDRGSPSSLSAQVTCVIYLHDVNDNAPQFQDTFYAASVPEDRPGGSPVVTVAAIDRDASAPNNVIVYRIQRGAADKFVIGADTGVISVAHGSSLDPDLTAPKKTTHYGLMVLALDGGLGEHQKLASTLVNITILDVNNKAPTIAEPERITMLENTPVGTEIYRVHAQDLDDNAQLRFALNAQLSEARSEEGILIKASEYNFVEAFEIDAETGRVRVRRLVDRERIEQIKLAVVVEDIAAAGAKQTDTAFLQVLVEDENDNNPQFRKPFYTKAITENSVVGTAILHVAAYDVDKNRSVTYALQGPPAIVDLVHMDAETGELVVAQRIDYETVQWLNYTVRATDSGQPARSTLVDVFVRVVDENDNNPYFLEAPANLSVPENSAIGTRIAVVRAADADAGDFGKITFLIDKMSSQGKFMIDADTGVLMVADDIDREERAGYMVVIEAWDNYQFGYLSGESRNAFKQFFIAITDENDSPPVLHLPATTPIQISEYHDLGEPVAHIRATDADDPDTPNGRVEFRIGAVGSGNAAGDLFKLVALDPWSCALFARRSLHDYFGNYTIAVQAHDLGRPSNEAAADLMVVVLDFNDHAPYFVAPGKNVTVRVPENATIGTHIVQVRALDDDIGPNAAVLYRFKTDSLGNYRTFSIDARTGNITLRQSLDRDRQRLYELRVEAYDQGVPPLTSDLDLSIYVRNVNDYEPQFLVDDIRVNFTEHERPGVERIKLPDTVDRDEVDDLDDPPSQVCYFIVYGNAAGHFHLDARAHVLTVVRELDRERAANHTLVVKATENCDEQPAGLDLSALAQREDMRLSYQSSSAALMMRPRAADKPAAGWFDRHKHSRNVRASANDDADDENDVDLAWTLHDVGADDPTGNNDDDDDDDDAPRMMMVMESETPEPTLSFEETLHDADNNIAPRLRPESAATERRLLTDALQEDGTLVQVHIAVLDINDNAPAFASKVFTGGLTTTTDFGAEIMHVLATDPDAAANAVVRYYLVGEVHRTLAEGLDAVARPPFLVDERTGAVVLNFDPQPDMKGYFDFIVLANDTAGQQDVAHVFIYLLRDDQRVKFVLRQQPAQVRERIELFRGQLGNVTRAIVNVDDFKVHENRDGSVDKTKTDLYMHLVDRRDNSILEVEEVLQLIDQNIEMLDGLFKDFNVLDTQPSEALQLTGATANGHVMLWLVFANVFISTLLVVVLSLCFSQRKTYTRQLRAASVHSYVTSPADITIRTAATVAGVVPNTNKHSMQGSNPIWMKAYANEWFKNDDDETVEQSHHHRHHQQQHRGGGGGPFGANNNHGSGFDSLDENVLATESYASGKDGAGAVDFVSVAAGGGPFNVYQQIDRMTGSAQALTKKLETTEL